MHFVLGPSFDDILGSGVTGLPRCGLAGTAGRSVAPEERVRNVPLGGRRRERHSAHQQYSRRPEA